MEFIDSSDFGFLLQAKLFIGSLVLVFMFLFARRNPTDYDTQFQKRFRFALGIICCLLIVGCIILMINGPLPFAQSSYFLSLYGTSQPNDAMIQYGISPHNIIRPSDAYCFFGRQTFEQWCLGHDLCQIIALLALAIYFFSMKKSSVKWYVKIRKCIGYAMLLNAPGQLDRLHYLDRYELIPLLIYALVTYLLVRTYKKDAKEPALPNESQYDNKEFEAIAPKQEIKIEVKEPKEKKVRIRKPVNWRKLLLVLMACFTVSTIVMLVLFDCGYRGKFLQKHKGYKVWISEDYKYSYYRNRYEEINDNIVDWELGQRRHSQILHKTEYTQSKDGRHTYDKDLYLIDYDINGLGYSIGEENEYLWDLCKTIRQRNKDSEACILKNDDGNQYVQCTNIMDSRGKYYDYRYNQNIKTTSIIATSYIYCHNGIAYHIIKTTPLAESYLDMPHLYFENPNKDILYIPILLYSSIILLALSIIGLGIYFLLTNKRKQINNRAANILSWYINISMMVSSIILSILMIVGIETDGDFDVFDIDNMVCFSFWLFCSILFVNIPLLLYVSNKIEQEYSFDYLVPQWLKASIKKYLKNMAAMRACVVFLIYPTAYIATLPLGIFAGVYIIPAFGIFYLCIFISWIIEGRNTAIE